MMETTRTALFNRPQICTGLSKISQISTISLILPWDEILCVISFWPPFLFEYFDVIFKLPYWEWDVTFFPAKTFWKLLEKGLVLVYSRYWLHTDYTKAFWSSLHERNETIIFLKYLYLHIFKLLLIVLCKHCIEKLSRHTFLSKNEIYGWHKRYSGNVSLRDITYLLYQSLCYLIMSFGGIEIGLLYKHPVSIPVPYWLF